MTKDNKLYTIAEDIDVLAGHQFTIPFSAQRKDGTPVDLTLADTVIKWMLVNYIDPNNPIKTYTYNNNNRDGAIKVDASLPSDFDVHVAATDTENLVGEYRYQIEIKSPQDDVFRPIEGNVIIRSRNAEEAI